MWKNPNVGAMQHVTKWLWNTFTCGGVYAMYVAFDIPLGCQAEKEQLRTHDGMCNFIFEICEPWGREECRVGRRVYVLVYIGFIMWTCTPIYHVYVWRICLWYICVGRARCVGGSPCSYKFWKPSAVDACLVFGLDVYIYICICILICVILFACYTYLYEI